MPRCATTSSAHFAGQWWWTSHDDDDIGGDISEYILDIGGAWWCAVNGLLGMQRALKEFIPDGVELSEKSEKTVQKGMRAALIDFPLDCDKRRSGFNG